MQDARLVRRSALSLLGGAAASLVGSPQTAEGRQSFASAPRRGHRVLFGAWVPGGSQADEDVAHLIGRKLDIEHWYQGWGAEVSSFDLARAQDVVARGGVPLVTWEPWDYRAGRDQPSYALRRIAAGHFDDYIRANARQMAQVGRPVWLRFAHEMNGRAYPWSVGVNGNTGKHYVRAWRRVVRLFAHENATNVRFIWCPLVPGPSTSGLRRSFPGDRHVSFVGMDGYNAGTAADWGGWLSFDEVFGPLYHRLRRLSRRRIVIAETGCAESGGSKPEWIRAGFGRRLERRYPAVRAVVWFNEVREADWRLQSSPESLRAAKRAFRSGPFA